MNQESIFNLRDSITIYPICCKKYMMVPWKTLFHEKHIANGKLIMCYEMSNHLLSIFRQVHIRKTSLSMMLVIREMPPQLPIRMVEKFLYLLYWTHIIRPSDLYFPQLISVFRFFTASHEVCGGQFLTRRTVTMCRGISKTPML